MAAYHSKAGKAAQASGRAHQWTREEAATAREKAEVGMRRKYGEEALRAFVNDVEGHIRPGETYPGRYILQLFTTIMADHGITPRRS